MGPNTVALASRARSKAGLGVGCGPVRPATNIHFNEHIGLCHFITPFFLPLFNSKNIELSTGSVEVLVFAIVLKVETNLTATMLKVHL